MARVDAPFWAVTLLVLFGVASLGCFGFAAAHSELPSGAEIMTTDNCPPPADL
jgi:hypothetical protein